MNTAVQLRPIADRDRPRCDLVHGEPRELVVGELGRIALFGPGALVAYRLRSRRRMRLFVFRTLAVDDPLAAAVPGVRPRVGLLLELRSACRVCLARRLFSYLVKTGRDAAYLPDSFYLRVGATFGGRLPRHKVVVSLLSSVERARHGT